MPKTIQLVFFIELLFLAASIGLLLLALNLFLFVLAFNSGTLSIRDSIPVFLLFIPIPTLIVVLNLVELIDLKRLKRRALYLNIILLVIGTILADSLTDKLSFEYKSIFSVNLIRLFLLPIWLFHIRKLK